MKYTFHPRKSNERTTPSKLKQRVDEALARKDGRTSKPHNEPELVEAYRELLAKQR